MMNDRGFKGHEVSYLKGNIMKQLKSIDERILHLKQVKEAAEVGLARALFRQICAIMITILI